MANMDKRNNINFLYHYKGVGRRIKLNQKLSATSVALYHALLYFWNESRFSEPLMIERNEILSYSKLSEETYYKNLDLLRSEGFLAFIPGLHGKKLIKIFMIRFDLDWTSEKSRAYHPNNSTVSAPNYDQLPPENLDITAPKTGSSYKHKTTDTKNLIKKDMNSIKKNEPAVLDSGLHKEDPETSYFMKKPSLIEVIIFFKENNSTEENAKKFYSFNEKKNWKYSKNDSQVKNWESWALGWIKNSNEKKAESTGIYQPSVQNEINYLYESFCEGKPIAQYLNTGHYKSLGLGLTKNIMARAREKRYKELLFSGIHSDQAIAQTYISQDFRNEKYLNDNGIVIQIAKQLAIKDYFTKMRKQNIKKLNSKSPES